MRAVVVADGEPVDADLARLDGAELVIAADGGAGWLARHGRRPDLLVGDMDSVDADLVVELEKAGVPVERHPAAKEASDAELAVERAIAAGADMIILVGALGGARLDHELANLLMLADPDWRNDLGDLRIVRGTTTVRAAHAGRPLRVEAGVGGVVTLLPVGGAAGGVRTTGLRFPLAGEELRLGRSRGLSNEVTAPEASVELERGALLVVEMQPEGAHR